ncbi:MULTISPECIES: helix-turn-helix domain-containing protein [unclassified Streptomyces]|uniref:IclR family transcriptional regulator n=1 Tax=unclassified Streptomyces TaxID=2593676 RepID=UPI00070174E3|nr:MULTISPECIES: helix-turn-helix domain-containing protein [unclassified Streptomyces]KQX50733.1 IclR family transcriptional regulator [Streptomyces sp. Root1304]KRA84898.1 IclR family transcriptional regulator [Streptomyces sp. Root66D1]
MDTGTGREPHRAGPGGTGDGGIGAGGGGDGAARTDAGGAAVPARGRGVLEGAFALLDALRRSGDEAGVTELALLCGVPKGSVHRLLDQLVTLGAVERRGNRYRVGPQLYRLGQSWEPHPGLRPAARLPLQRLRAATGASVVLTVLREDMAITVGSVPGDLEPLLPVRDGIAFRLDTAAGKALRGPLRGGAVLDREDVMDGVCCAAVPVRTPDGRTVAALAGLVPAGRPLDGLARAVAEAGAAITRTLGRSGPRRTLPHAALVL